MNINGIGSFSIPSICGGSVDSEEKEIMRRLMAYGIKPTGDKTTDKAMLRRIELNEAKNNNFVTTKFLTVSKSEQEEIQRKKKEKKAEIEEPNKNVEKFIGSTALGEQIYLVMQKKKKKKSTTS